MESNEHPIYEMLSWFDVNAKNAPPRTPASGQVVKWLPSLSTDGAES
jgi:hypothetical protein